jgi:hypothetical protein
VLQIALSAVRQAAQPAPVLGVLAIVDSGASNTCFPMVIATRLGIADHELQQDADPSIGVEGQGYTTWSSTLPLEAWIVASTAQGSVAWGPRFPLSPSFSDKDPFLLGRADFFKRFTVTFQENLTPPVFHLDY